MSVDRIRELLEIMESHGLAELELQEGEFKVRLCKEQRQVAGAPAGAMAPLATSAYGEQASQGQAPDQTDLESIKSPIVGTFYMAPAPDAEAFVHMGSHVTEETIVCIVEAMKVMNEVKSGVCGVIAEVLVENGEAVEYGQPLFLVKQE